MLATSRCAGNAAGIWQAAVRRYRQGERSMDLTRRDGRLLLLGITLIACLAILALGVAAPQAKAASTGYDYYLTGNGADKVTTTQPGLLLAGGATDQDGAVQWWLKRAGRGDIVLIAASGKDDYSQYFWDMGQTREVGGVDSVEMFVLGTRKAGFDPFFIQKLNEADAIYFDGGNQWLYYSYLVGTPAGAIISKAAQTKPEGGISAGLAIQGQFAYTAQNGTITSDQALANPYHTHVTLVDDFLRMPWLGNVITDSHFVARDRMGRHVTFLARIVKDGWTTQAKGIAVNEDNTVTVNEKGQAELWGDGAAYFTRTNGVPQVCAKNKPLTYRDVSVYKLTAGGSFDLRTWTGSGGDAYTVSAVGGVMSSTQPDGSLY
jgi:cyanophycinase